MTLIFIGSARTLEAVHPLQDCIVFSYIFAAKCASQRYYSVIVCNYGLNVCLDADGKGYDLKQRRFSMKTVYSARFGTYTLKCQFDFSCQA